MDVIKWWDNKFICVNCDYFFYMVVIWWGEQVFNDMKIVIEQCGINMFKYFFVYKGVLMVNDDELFVLFNCLFEFGGIVMVYVENGDVVVEMIVKLLVEGNIGFEGYVYFCLI